MIHTELTSGINYYDNEGEFAYSRRFQEINPDKSLVHYVNKYNLLYYGVELVTVNSTDILFYVSINKDMISFILNGYTGNKNDLTIQISIYIVEFY